MLRGLGDRRLACDRDLLFLRWVLVKKNCRAPWLTARHLFFNNRIDRLRPVSL
jgi:hypothetical protein